MYWTTTKNRKNESNLRLGPALMAVTLCALFAMLGVGYVWYKNQIGLLGRQIKEHEMRLTELERDNRLRRDQLAQACSPVALDARVRQLRLDLGPPALTQIVSLVERDPTAIDRRQALVADATHNE
jgi:hypothetical protein